MTTAITADMSSVAAVYYAVLGGKFRLRMVRDDGIGHRWADVLDADGNVIGDADDFIYGAGGWAVHTGPFAGFVKNEQIEFDEVRLHQRDLFQESEDARAHAES